MMKKKWIPLLLALIMVLSCSAPVMAYDAVSEPDYYTNNFVDKVKVKNTKTQAITEFVYATYGSNDKYFKGSGECYGYAEMIRQFYGTGYRQRNYKVKATPANMYKYLKNLKPGTHVRFSNTDGGKNPSHSIVLLKISKTTLWYTDGNVGAYNAVLVRERSLSDFCSSAKSWGYKRMVWSREPKGRPTAVSTPAIRTLADWNGPETHIVWRPVRNAKSYIVYRSSSKNGKYKKLATVKNSMYIDRSTDLYGKAYYKVKAVLSGNRSLTSKPVPAKRRIKAPRAYLTMSYGDDYESATFNITWSEVPGAVKYNLYIYDFDRNKYVKHGVHGTSYEYTSYDYDSIDLIITAVGSRKGSESLPERLCYW